MARFCICCAPADKDKKDKNKKAPSTGVYAEMPPTPNNRKNSREPL